MINNIQTISSDKIQHLSWHETAWDQINAYRENDKLPHAILIRGQAGVGKHIFAKQMSQLMLCDSAAKGYACNECSSCALINSESHPDFFRLSPDEGKNTIAVDKVRLLCDQLTQSAHRDGYQVVLFDPITALTNSAANALLKTLEEPMGNVLILAIMPSNQALLATLYSRFTVIDIAGNSELVQVNESVSAGHLHMIHKIAAASPLYAEALVHNQSWELAIDLFEHCGKVLAKKSTVFDKSDYFSKQDIHLFLTWFYCIINDCIKIKLGADISLCVYAHYERKLRYLSAHFSLWDLFKLIDKLNAAFMKQKSIVSFNEQYIIDNLLLAWQSFSGSSH